MEYEMNHLDVVAFGTELNSIATHKVLPSGLGHRLSLVYEFAVHDAVWDLNNTTTFHQHMGVQEGKFVVIPLKNQIKIKTEEDTTVKIKIELPSKAEQQFQA